MTGNPLHSPFDPTALERMVPRYVSYPTEPHFTAAVDHAAYARWLGGIPAGLPLALYVHVPFCSRICWFCACRTQSVVRGAGLRRYVMALVREAATVAAALPPGCRVSEIAWGGGSPSVLEAPEIRALSAVLHRVFPGAAEAPLEAELDARDLDPARLAALAEAGLAAATVSLGDIDPGVQAAIGRHQDHASTIRAVDGLRAHGVGRITVDLLYGLPAQTSATLARTVEAALALAPDRVALYGYAHMPWQARRQAVIDARALPDLAARRDQAAAARAQLVAAGLVPVGHDMFARPGDALVEAAQAGRLARCFAGYRPDTPRALIGLGASAVGALPQGYVQNARATAGYIGAVEAGRLATSRGHALRLDDRLRRDVIGQILCGGGLDLDALGARYGDFVRPVAAHAAALMARAPAGVLVPWRGGFRVDPAWQSHLRLIAAEFDAYRRQGAARHPIAL
ncbi:oxygen-independent coproporphyrinogen III oxidase [Paralimibaculum aggregatum]|uniref:Coproporphyrinogen-III oxidase n=1 Tax=Paralimibaculum aggregatum TaxID=3036245 RepID=A0ABQ6LQ65_9RHOB|nr:radical SAM protein [Limibaculum sp. NKW23]GMG84650.1 oxygen-independent coproporphyrinogen III oxidase [Limibaculum sp. NKW23]